MKKALLITVLAATMYHVCTPDAAAQVNIHSILSQMERRYVGPAPIMVIETTEFQSPKQTNTFITYFDTDGTVKSTELAQNKQLIAHDVVTAVDGDPTKKIIHKRNLIGDKWLTFYLAKTYDANGKLTNEVATNSYSDTTSMTEIIYDSDGFPVRVLSKNRTGDISGIEIAEYDHENNKMTLRVTNARGDVISTSDRVIFHRDAWKHPRQGCTYDENGWLIRTEKVIGGESVVREYEYATDTYGNITKTTVFVVTEKPNGKRKRTLERISSTLYIYPGPAQ